MKKLLVLGSVVSACPPKKQGGTERVAYYQAKHLAKRGVPLIFVGAKGTIDNFHQQLKFEGQPESEKILANIEFVEIGGGTGLGSQEDAIKFDSSKVEGSRLLRLEMVNLAKVQRLMIEKKDHYDAILNNMRGEAALIPLANQLGKQFINVMHLNIFGELAEIFSYYQTHVITISNAQRKNFPNLKYLETIYNPVSTSAFPFNLTAKDYALMVGTIGPHKNQKDAILACQKAKMPLYLAGKIRDQKYFDAQVKPYIDGKAVTQVGELNFEAKLKLYQEAKVFLFPIAWQEPFGLVCIEALSCGTPVIAYPNGGPSEIVKNGVNGFLVNSVDEMAQKISEVDKIKREDCRKDVETRFSEEVIGQQYFDTLQKLLQ